MPLKSTFPGPKCSITSTLKARSMRLSRVGNQHIGRKKFSFSMNRLICSSTDHDLVGHIRSPSDSPATNYRQTRKRKGAFTLLFVVSTRNSKGASHVVSPAVYAQPENDRLPVISTFIVTRDLVRLPPRYPNDERIPCCRSLCHREERRAAHQAWLVSSASTAERWATAINDILKSCGGSNDANSGAVIGPGRRLLVLINPVSGTGGSRSAWEETLR